MGRKLIEILITLSVSICAYAGNQHEVKHSFDKQLRINIERNSAECLNLIEYLSKVAPRLKRFQRLFPEIEVKDRLGIDLSIEQIKKIQFSDHEQFIDLVHYPKLSGERRFELVQDLLNHLLTDEQITQLQGKEALAFYEVDRFIKLLHFSIKKNEIEQLALMATYTATTIPPGAVTVVAGFVYFVYKIFL